MSLPAQIQLANTFGNWVDATNDIIVTAGNSSHYILVSQNATPTVSTGNISVNGVMTLATLKANGGIGTAGQFLTSNGSTIHWSTVVDANSSTSGLVNTSVQTFTGNKTFADNVAVTGSITVNALSANGSLGTAGQFLTSNATVAYWSTLSVVDANSSASGLVNTSTQTFSGNKTFGNDVGISGNLTVSGTTTYINTTNLQIGDNIIALNADLTAITAPTESAGIEINRGSSANTYFQWNETDDVWQVTTDGTNYGTLIDTRSTTGINASALSTGTVPLARFTSANTTANGIVDTTTQTFAGAKSFTGATTLTTSIFNANTSTGMTANGKLTLNTTNGRFVLPVGADLWAL